MRDAAATADVLVQALPYIRRFAGKSVVVKLGGAAIDVELDRALAQDVLLLRSVGVRCVLIQANGDMFTAGNDVGEFAAVAAGKSEGSRNVVRFIQSLARCTRPLVAAVQGRAVGVGTTMLLHCDLVVLADNAQLSTPFVSLALVPEAASSLLMPARIGYARAYEMFALGETVLLWDRGTYALA